MRRLLLFLIACATLPAQKTEFRAGLAKLDITPSVPIWMSGYANRDHPSEGVLTRLYAKALAVEDNKRTRVVIVTTDLIGLPRAITDELSARAQKQYGLGRSQLLFNSSHTHTGPVVRPNLHTMYELHEPESAKLNDYAVKLREDLFTIIGAALGDLKPANLSFTQTTAGFAINRREVTPKGIRLGLNPGGPVDHSVPVLAVRGQDGSLKAILYGYACHNTTLTGQHYKISGDYAAYSQQELEATHSGAQAMFILLCGGDQNPNPRGTEEHAIQHGKSLADAVGKSLAGKLTPVRAPLRSAFQTVDLRFAIHTREQFEKEAQESNVFRARRAREMLALYDQRRPIRTTPYPVQAIRFGSEFTLLALGGEVVIDYALRAKKEFPHHQLVVAGYSNDVMCYIPSLRVLKEGGYEAVDSMVYYGMPGPFADDVEELVFDAITRTLRRVEVEKKK